MPRRIIGFIGDIGSGKTTAANYLEQKYKFTHYAFATPLKKIGEIFGFTKNQLYGTQEEKLEINKYHGISGREFMEKFGTDIGRIAIAKIIPTMSQIWVRLFEIFAEENKTDIVVGDVRFPNEADAIERFGGILIKIVRPDQDTKKLRKDSKSESAKTEITTHATIVNNGQLDDFYKCIEHVVDTYNTIVLENIYVQNNIKIIH